MGNMWRGVGSLIAVLTEVVSELLNNGGGLSGLDGLVVLADEDGLSGLDHDNTSGSLLACKKGYNHASKLIKRGGIIP